METCDTIMGSDAWVPQGSHVKDIKTRLEKASRKAEMWVRSSENVTLDQKIIAAGDLTNAHHELPLDGIIDWAIDSDVSVSVEPIDNKLSFSKNKTY